MQSIGGYLGFGVFVTMVKILLIFRALFFLSVENRRQTKLSLAFALQLHVDWTKEQLADIA